MSGGFVKLYGDKLLDSSVWIGTPSNVKILWIALLALADAQGRVIKGLPGLAHRADLTRKEVDEALVFLKAPDPDSQTPDFEGRRIENIEGGWQLLTYQLHREYRSEKQEKERVRKAEWRQSQPGHVPDVPSCDDTEAEAEAEAEIDSSGEKDLAGEKDLNNEGSSMSLVPSKSMELTKDTGPWIMQQLETIPSDQFDQEVLLWEARATFAYWAWRTVKSRKRPGGRDPVLTEDRKKLVYQWLRVYGFEDCLFAVGGAWHHPDKNQENGRNFHGWKHIFHPEGTDDVEKLSEEGRRHPKIVKQVASIVDKLKEQGWHGGGHDQ